MENQELEVSNNKSFNFSVMLVVMTLLVMIAGSTFAYLRWQSSDSQKTAVTFTVTSGFTCSADGGGKILPGDMGLIPTDCTDATYAVKREITVNPRLNGAGSLYMDLWLNINSIGTGLSNSQNFKYALTTSSTSCTTGVVADGNFKGKSAGNKVTLLNSKYYTQTTTDTYYLWIWLDAAETSASTQGQSFELELGGVCNNALNSSSMTVYTANLNDVNATNTNSVMIGSPVPNDITTYNSPDAAMTALKTAYSTLYNGATANLPFFLKHTIEFDTVTESYAGFVVTPQMASDNPGMTAGTYYLRGDNMREYDSTNGSWNCKSEFIDPGTGDCMTSQYYNANKAVLQSAFGTNNNYCNDHSFDVYCHVPGVSAYAYSNGIVGAGDYAGSDCSVGWNGFSNCLLDDSDWG